MGVLGRFPPDLSVCKMGIMLVWGQEDPDRGLGLLHLCVPTGPSVFHTL